MPRVRQKKNPAQLDREIADALRRRSKLRAVKAPRKRAHSTKGSSRRGKDNGRQGEILMVANDAALEDQFDRAEEILGQGKQRAIAQSFTTVTPESAEAGDYASRGWEDRDGAPIEVTAYDIEEQRELESDTPVTDAIVEKAVEWLRDHGASETSSSKYHPGVWYSTEFEISDYSTGEERQEDFFLRNFTADEERRVFDEFMHGRR